MQLNLKRKESNYRMEMRLSIRCSSYLSSVAVLLSPERVTCTACLILLDLNTLILFGETLVYYYEVFIIVVINFSSLT